MRLSRYREMYRVSESCFALDMEWRTVAFTVLAVSLCFLAIPVKVGPDPPDSTSEDIKLFEGYVTRYNKSYKHDAAEYEERFKRFQVSRTTECDLRGH